MAIKGEEDFNQDDEQEKIDREAEAARVKALEDDLNAEKIARARAEGEAEALKRVPAAVPQAQAQWTDEQWEQEGAKMGMTGAQLRGSAAISNTIAEQKIKPALERAEAAEKRAEAAERKAEMVKSGQSIYAIEQDFYSKNPGLVGRRADVDEFMATQSEEVKNDPKRYSKALEMAKKYAIGNARENIANKRSNGQNRNDDRRFNNDKAPEFDNENNRSNDDVEIDTSELEDNEAEFITKLNRNISSQQEKSKDIRNVPIEEAVKLSKRRDNLGVSIDSRSEFEEGARIQDREISSGTQGRRR